MVDRRPALHRQDRQVRAAEMLVLVVLAAKGAWAEAEWAAPQEWAELSEGRAERVA